MKNQIFDFNNIATGKPVKAIQQAFARAGVPVISIDADGKAKRTAGVSHKTMTLAFADSQTVELSIKQSGDVYQVKINGSLIPLKNPDDHAKAVGEISKALEAGRAKFQAKLARAKVDLPKGIKTAAPKMEQQLTAQIQELDTKIAERRVTLEELKAGQPVMDAAQHEGDGEVDESEQDDDKQGKLFAKDGDEESDDDDDTDQAMDAVGNYKINHQTFSAACAEAIRVAESRGFTVDDDDWFSKVSTGPRKPQPGATNKYLIALLKDGKETKKALAFQVYGKENGDYELNCYIG